MRTGAPSPTSLSRGSMRRPLHRSRVPRACVRRRSGPASSGGLGGSPPPRFLVPGHDGQNPCLRATPLVASTYQQRRRSIGNGGTSGKIAFTGSFGRASAAGEPHRAGPGTPGGSLLTRYPSPPSVAGCSPGDDRRAASSPADNAHRAGAMPSVWRRREKRKAPQPTLFHRRDHPRAVDDRGSLSLGQ